MMVRKQVFAFIVAQYTGRGALEIDYVRVGSVRLFFTLVRFGKVRFCL